MLKYLAIAILLCLVAFASIMYFSHETPNNEGELHKLKLEKSIDLRRAELKRLRRMEYELARYKTEKEAELEKNKTGLSSEKLFEIQTDLERLQKIETDLAQYKIEMETELEQNKKGMSPEKLFKIQTELDRLREEEANLKSKNKSSMRVYNLAFKPLKQEDPIVLYSGRPTLMAFNIGPPWEKSVLPPLEIDGRYKYWASMHEDEAAAIPITVRMVCGVCEKNATQSRTIYFDPRTEQSTKALFEIEPSRVLVQRVGGLGQIDLTLLMRGYELNHIALDVFVDEADPGKIVDYKRPQIEFLPLPSELGPPPDLVISITPESSDGCEVAVSFDPVLPGLTDALSDLVFDHKEERLRKFIIYFPGNNDEFKRLARDAYKRLRQMVHPDDKERAILKQVYEAQGLTVFDRSWPSTATELIPQHRDKALMTFKEVGQDIYLSLFDEFYGGSGLREVLRVVESYKTENGRPLRISIHTSYFLPWQLLYPNYTDQDDSQVADPDKFWGFKYELAVRQIVRGQTGRLDRLVLRPKINEVVFAKGQAIVPKDPIEDLAESLAATLYASYMPLDQIPILNTDRSFIGSLERKADNLALVFLFSHGSSGSHIIWDSTRWGPRPITLHDDIGPHILFTREQIVTPRHIQRISNRVRRKPVWSKGPVFVLNACETGTGGVDPSNSGLFVTTLMILGARSVIVTESEVWTLFGAAWAERFIIELSRGSTIAEAVLNARRFHLYKNHNPMGLLYSLYGSISTRVEFPDFP